MLRQRICGILALLLLIAASLTFYGIYRNSFDTFDDAKTRCGHNVWVVYQDSPWIDMYKIDFSDPAALQFYQGKPAEGASWTFTCNENRAQNIERFEEGLQMLFYIFLLPLWLPLLLLLAVIWWLRDEYRYWRKKTKK